MKKILFITALLIGFFGNSQIIPPDSTVAYTSRKGRLAEYGKGNGGGSATTDASLLTSGVLANGRVQESNVTQHQGALSIAKDQIPGLVDTDSQQIVDFSITSNIATLELEDGGTDSIDLSPYLDNKNVASGSLSGSTLTLTLSDASTVVIDLSGLGGGSSDGLGSSRDVGAFTVVDGDNATLNAGINANKIGDGSVSNTAFQYIANLVNDAQQQLDSKLNTNGSASMAGNLGMGGFKIINLANGTNAQDAVTLSQLTAATGSNITVHPDSDETSIRLGIADDATSLASFTTLSTDIIICKICPSIIAASSTTIDFSETGRHAFFDGDGNSDPASYTLSNMQNGHLLEIYANQATEPTFSPTPTQTTDSLDWDDDSLANTNVTGYIYKNGKGNVLLTWVKDF